MKYNKLIFFLTLFSIIVCDAVDDTLNFLVGSCTCSSLKIMISDSEVKKSCVYKDKQGHSTIGIGFNLESNNARSICYKYGINYDLVRKGSQCLSNEQISRLFDNTVDEILRNIPNCVNLFSSLPVCIQNVLVDMTFHMGESFLCGWPNFVAQLARKEYSEAAENMKSSNWCKEVGARCTRNARIINSC